MDGGLVSIFVPSGVDGRSVDDGFAPPDVAGAAEEYMGVGQAVSVSGEAVGVREAASEFF